MTTLVDMPLNCIPVTTTRAALETKLGAVGGSLRVDVGFWGGVGEPTIAVAAPAKEEGRMVVGAPGPLSLETANRILAFSMLTYHGEAYDSFAGVRAHAGRTSQFYAWDQGSVTTLRWDHGLGLKLVDGELLYDGDAYEPLPPAAPWLAPARSPVRMSTPYWRTGASSFDAADLRLE